MHAFVSEMLHVTEMFICDRNAMCHRARNAICASRLRLWPPRFCVHWRAWLFTGTPMASRLWHDVREEEKYDLSLQMIFGES